MKIMPNALTPNIRELPVSLKLNNNTQTMQPIKNNGYIIDPTKYQNDIKDVNVEFKEIKALLLMMIKGNSDYINELVNTSGSNFVNTSA